MGSKTDLRVNISQSLCYTSLLLKCLLSKILKVIWCFKQEQKKEYVHLWKRTWENSIICIKEPLVTFYSFLIWNIWRLSPKDFKWGSIPFHDSSSVQFSRSVVSDSLRPHESQQSGLPVHHQLPEFTQTHVHRVSDAIQPSHPLSSPSPPAPNLSQHQGLFQWVTSSHEVAKVLEFQL